MKGTSMACMFCTHCGACSTWRVNEPGYCPLCGAKVPLDKRSCPTCGAPIARPAGEMSGPAKGLRGSAARSRF
ncbi:zinc-ribbon domain-containing protein [Slackia piriformis]